jgi:hypothetical protein
MARKGSAMIERCIYWINSIFRQCFRDKYTEHGGVFFGEHMFAENIGKTPINEIPLETFIPIEFPKNKRIWYSEEEKLEDYLKDISVCIALNHSQNKGWVNQCPMDKMLKRECLMGEIFRYSESIGSLL